MTVTMTCGGRGGGGVYAYLGVLGVRIGGAYWRCILGVYICVLGGGIFGSCIYLHVRYGWRYVIASGCSGRGPKRTHVSFLSGEDPCCLCGAKAFLSKLSSQGQKGFNNFSHLRALRRRPKTDHQSPRPHPSPPPIRSPYPAS